MYTQATEPGYLVEFEVGMRVYSYHATRKGFLKLCPASTPRPPPGGTSQQASEAKALRRRWPRRREAHPAISQSLLVLLRFDLYRDGVGFFILVRVTVEQQETALRGEATSPPETSSTVSTALPPAGTEAGMPVAKKRGRPSV